MSAFALPDPSQAAPGGAGGLPPEIAQLLRGGQGPGPVGPQDQSDAPGGDNLSFLQDAIDAASQYVQGEDDQIHVQTALQCIAKLQSILAEEQKQSDGLLEGKATPRAMRRATGGAGGSY